jgi:hypothetical protein
MYPSGKCRECPQRKISSQGLGIRKELLGTRGVHVEMAGGIKEELTKNMAEIAFRSSGCRGVC